MTRATARLWNYPRERRWVSVLARFLETLGPAAGSDPSLVPAAAPGSATLKSVVGLPQWKMLAQPPEDVGSQTGRVQVHAQLRLWKSGIDRCRGPVEACHDDIVVIPREELPMKWRRGRADQRDT
jgi:hypothetical protein